jgi:hypothetical protein
MVGDDFSIHRNRCIPLTMCRTARPIRSAADYRHTKRDTKTRVVENEMRPKNVEYIWAEPTQARKNFPEVPERGC